MKKIEQEVRKEGKLHLIRENLTAVLRGDISEGLPTEFIWVELKNKKGENNSMRLY